MLPQPLPIHSGRISIASTASLDQSQPTVFDEVRIDPDEASTAPQVLEASEAAAMARVVAPDPPASRSSMVEVVSHPAAAPELADDAPSIVRKISPQESVPTPPRPLPERVDRVPPRKSEVVLQPASDPSLASAASTGADVDQIPSRFYNPDPEYPPEALAARITGRVVLRVKVDAAGLVTSVAVYRTSGTPVLDTAAMSAVRRWRFQPARRGGHAVPYEIAVPIRFVIP